MIAMGAIKNYTSDIPINRIFERIQTTLVQHGAKQIVFDYGEDGAVRGVAFVILVQGRGLSIKLPVRVDKAQAVLKQQYETGVISRRMGSGSIRPNKPIGWRGETFWIG
jgi:hypothetical protein